MRPPEVESALSLHRRVAALRDLEADDALAAGYPLAAEGLRREAAEEIRDARAIEEEWGTISPWTTIPS